MHRPRVASVAGLLLLALVVALPVSSAHGWAAQRTDVWETDVMVQDVTDDWGVSHQLVDGHDLGAIFVVEEQQGSQRVVRFTVGFAAGYATPGGTGERRIDVTVNSPRVAGIVSISTNNNQGFSVSGTNGLDPVLLQCPYQWLDDTNGADGDPMVRKGCDFMLRYEDLKVANGEALSGVGATSYIGASQKADFLPGGYWTATGNYVSSPPGNSSGPPDGYVAVSTRAMRQSTWTAPSAGTGPTNAAPAAQFNFAPTNPRVGEPVQFTDASTDAEGAISSWAWDFGDGNTSADRNPRHTYGSAGPRVVKLRVTDAGGLHGFLNQTLEVRPRLLHPVADLRILPAEPLVGTNVTFTDASVNGSAPLANWTWTFGDGTGAFTRNATHAYASAGAFNVTLRVTDAEGLASQVNRTLTVTARATLRADFAPELTTPPVGAPVGFRDESVPGAAPIVSREWNFGDGTTATGENVTHTFSAPGNYTVILTVRDAQGALARHEITVVVAPREARPSAPIAGFAWEPKTARALEPVLFRDTSVATASAIVAWQWDFGDGSGSLDKNARHTYLVPGSYLLTLRVRAADGQEANATDHILITRANEPPEARIAGPERLKVGEEGIFLDESRDFDGRITGRTWSFGDGTTSGLAEARHSFAAPGTYVVTLRALDDAGGNSLASKSVVVEEAPAPVAEEPPAPPRPAPADDAPPAPAEPPAAVVSPASAETPVGGALALAALLLVALAFHGRRQG